MSKLSQPHLWWLSIGLIYLTARTLSAFILTSFSQQQGSMPFSGFWGEEKTSYSYLDFLQLWDTGWYYEIYKQGYPQELPEYNGVVTSNAWAFYPLYPFLVRSLSILIGQNGTDAGWYIFSPLVAFVAGLGVSLILYKVFALVTGHKKSLWAVAFFSFSPVSPILQVAYAESLGILFLVAALYFVLRGKYSAASPFILCMSLLRPLIIGFGLMLGIVFITRLVATLKNKRWIDLIKVNGGSGPEIKNLSAVSKKHHQGAVETISSPSILLQRLLYLYFC